jgi:hypothetical protein
LPSAILVAGASSFTFPSGVRGAPAVGCKDHCADSDGGMATTIVIVQAAQSRILTMNLENCS